MRQNQEGASLGIDKSVEFKPGVGTLVVLKFVDSVASGDHGDEQDMFFTHAIIELEDTYPDGYVYVDGSKVRAIASHIVVDDIKCKFLTRHIMGDAADEINASFAITGVADLEMLSWLEKAAPKQLSASELTMMNARISELMFDADASVLSDASCL